MAKPRPRTLVGILDRILNLLSVNCQQARDNNIILREIKRLMSQETDQLTTALDNLQTGLQNLAAHQTQAFADLKSEVNALPISDTDKAGVLAATARAQGFTQDIANMDTAATAADPGPAIVTLPGSPPAVTPPTPPSGSPASGSGTDGAAGGSPQPILGTSQTGVLPGDGLAVGGPGGDPTSTAGLQATTAVQPGNDQAPNDAAKDAPEATSKPAPLDSEGNVAGTDQQTANPNGVNPGGSPAQGAVTADGSSQNPNELDNSDATTGNADRTPANPNPDGSQGGPQPKSADLADAGSAPGAAV